MEATPYFGTYERVQEVTEEESRHLSSNESVIGSLVTLVFDEDGDGRERVCVESARGYSLGHFSPDFSSQLTALRQEGLICTAYLSAVAYAESNGLFWGEFAVVCYAPDQATAWEHYCANLKGRIANGDHPDMQLGKKNLARVIDSNGVWCLNKSIPYEKLDRGGVYFKKKRSWSDALVEMAVSGNMGCKIIAVLFWIVLAAAVIFFVWSRFFAD
jgi:hypothetical protein